MDTGIARRMWLVGEPLHAVTYFAPESLEAWKGAGLRGFWRGYFATRAAPLGAVGPEVVIATFFNFAPAMVERALPEVWQMATPADAVAARTSGAAEALSVVLGESAPEAALAGAAEVVREAVGACSPGGRALFAGNAGLDWPDDPLAALWHGLTCIREHRGDGHNAALLVAGIDGCEAHILASAVGSGGADEAARQQARGWTDDEWAAARARLQDRELIGADGAVTSAGAELHADVEARTDEAAMAPWRHLGATATAELEATLRPWAEAVIRSGVVRFPNPMGLPRIS